MNVLAGQSPRRVRGSPQESGVESLRSSLIETLKQVSVGIQGDLNRGMSEPQLDDFRMLPLGDEYRGVRVPEIVKPEWLTD